MTRRQRLSIMLATINLIWPFIVAGNLFARIVPDQVLVWAGLTLIALVSGLAGLWSLPVAAYLGALIAEIFVPGLVHTRRGMNHTVVLVWGAVCGVGLRCVWFEWKIFREHLTGNPSQKRRGPILWLASRPRQVWGALAAVTLWVNFLLAISFLFVRLGPALSGDGDWPW